MTLFASYLGLAGAASARVRAATTANITLSAAQTIDGVSVVAGDRVLVKNQSTGAQNGVYVCAAGAWARADDLPAAASAASLLVAVSEGTANGATLWQCSDNVGADVVGTDALTFTGGIKFRARQSAITAVAAFTDPPSAAEMAALRTAVNAIITTLQNLNVTA